MSNTAYIATSNNDLMIYLHWNGGLESVNAFLKYCELQQFPCPSRSSYGWARLCQVIANFLGGSSSVGIEPYDHKKASHTDNGVYIIQDWNIVSGGLNSSKAIDDTDLVLRLKQIDEKQPVESQLGGLLDAEEVLPVSLKLGDVVYIRNVEKLVEATVIGFGRDMVVNGTNVKGYPYVDFFGKDKEMNINNYIRGKIAKRKRTTKLEPELA